MNFKNIRVYTLFLFIVTILSGCVTTEYNPATHTQDIFFYSTEKEVNLGRKVARQVEKEYTIEKNPKINQRIYRIGKKLSAVCDRQEINYYFDVIEDKDKNAFSLPGGYVYVNTGLLDILETDDQIAFVLAHEIGHIVARHSIKRLQASLGYNLLLIAGSQIESSGDSPVQSISLILATLTSGYAQEDEYLADALATEYTEKAGFDPKAGVTVLAKLQEARKEEGRTRIAYFRTHPFASQRIKRIKQTLGLPLEFKDVINY